VVRGLNYPPHVAVVRFGRIVERPWATDGMIGARPIVTAALAGHHGVSDGMRGARFFDATDHLLQGASCPMNDFELRQIFESVIHPVAPEADLGRLSPAVDFRDELEMDSMDFLIVVDELHERTGVDIPERDYPQLSTVDGCVAYLTARLPAPAP
jgi:acyl carrier protein